MSNNPYEGSQHYPNVSGTTLATTIPDSMIKNGWQFRDQSNAYRTIWQYIRRRDNGRHDEIRLNGHEKEGLHYHVKIMIKQEEKPTKEQFIQSIAPELKNSVEKTLEKEKSSIPYLSMMKLCSQCGSEISANSVFCPICGKHLEE
jgi:hypothetical protein